MTDAGSVYEFVFRGLLTEEALDSAGRRVRDFSGVLDAEIAEKLSLSLLDEEMVVTARRMSTVYTAIAAFENSARELVGSTMIEPKVRIGGHRSRQKSAIAPKPDENEKSGTSFIRSAGMYR